MVIIMSLSQKELEQAAGLARIELSEKEVTSYTEQLNSILEYVEPLKSLDLANVEPTIYGVSLNNVLRNDEVKPSITQEEALANAPEGEDGFFRVPKIV